MQVLCSGNLQLQSSDLQGPVSGEDHFIFHPFPWLCLASRLYLLPFLDFVCCAPISLSVNCEMGRVLANCEFLGYKAFQCVC